MAQDLSKVFIDPSVGSIQTDFGTNTLWQERTLAEGTVLRSIAMDYKKFGTPTKPWVFGIQSLEGGTTTGSRRGDLRLNRLRSDGSLHEQFLLTHEDAPTSPKYWLQAESPDDYFEQAYLTDGGEGFGNGRQIGIEYAPDGTYIWVESSSPIIDREKSSNASQFEVVGQTISRIKVDGGHQVFSPKIGGTQKLNMNEKLGLPATIGQSQNWTYGLAYTSVSIDNENKLIAITYRETNRGGKNGLFKEERVAIYSYDYANYNNSINSINFKLLSKRVLPQKSWWKARDNGKCSSAKGNLPLGGFAIYGDYIYLGRGTAYWNSDPSKVGQDDFYSPATIPSGEKYYDGTNVTSTGNTHIMLYNWKLGQLVKENHTEAGKSNVHREIHGLSIIPIKDSNGDVTKLTLYMGFAGGNVGDRHWTIFHKENNDVPL